MNQLVEFLKKYRNIFFKSAPNHYKIQGVKKYNNELIFYCKEDGSKAVFAVSGNELINQKQYMLEKFNDQDKINIIKMTVSSVNNTTIAMQQSSSAYFSLLAMLFSSCLLISNILAQKLVPLFGFTITGSDFVYIMTYILGDIITEVYGYKKSRQLIWCTVLINLIAFISYKIAIWLPASPYWDNQYAFKVILDSTGRMIFASLTAYVVSEFANSYIVARVKVLTKGKKLWLRIILASICSITIDNFGFMFLAYYGSMPLFEIFKSSGLEYLFSIVAEFLCIPLIVLAANYIKQRDKIDTIDINTNFTPFSLNGEYVPANNIYTKDNVSM